ncbi:GNAT family N-acetyltransferase [soil metagenome]
MEPIEIQVAQAHQNFTFENLMQLYVHDFSEQWSDQARGEVDENGLFESYPLAPYWRDDGEHIPLLLWHGEYIVGFALLNRHSHAGRTLDRNMAEFFILRKHRRGGVGLAAAQAIVRRFPGVWEAAVARRNIGALHFWRKVASAYAGVEETDIVSDDWNGPVLRFRA